MQDTKWKRFYQFGCGEGNCFLLVGFKETTNTPATLPSLWTKLECCLLISWVSETVVDLLVVYTGEVETILTSITVSPSVWLSLCLPVTLADVVLFAFHREQVDRIRLHFAESWLLYSGVTWFSKVFIVYIVWRWWPSIWRHYHRAF